MCGPTPSRRTSWELWEEATVIQVGDKAPAVIGRTYDGTTVDLGAPGKRTVLYFYPKAGTSG
jgi:peroxiredoxin